MSIIKRAGDLVYTFRFLKLLVTPFDETEAYKKGIIDERGNRRKEYDTNTVNARKDLKNYYTPFHRLVFNIKKLLAKAPGGSSRIASYAAALYLLKEKYDLSDSNLERILSESNIEVMDFMTECNDWFVTEDQMLSPGLYRLQVEKLVNETLDEIAKANDKIRVEIDSYPVGDVFGVNVYEAKHINTGQTVYITSGEIRR